MPHVPIRQTHRYRFAGFEYREQSGELLRNGEAVPLPNQAAKVLLALVRSQGQVVTREDLRQELWPDKVSGEFESGINVAVRKLRKALDDEGTNPSLIGTLPTHGYRMLVPVEILEDKPEASDPLMEPSVPSQSELLGGQARPSGANPLPRSGFGRLGPIHTAIFGGVLITVGVLYWVFGNSGIRSGSKPGELLRDKTSSIDFVWVPPGIFNMGSPEKGYWIRSIDENQHLVRLSHGFWLGRFEVTQRQYEAVMGTNPSGFRDSGPDAPVENVSWYDAQEFLEKLNQRGSGQTYRLPTEAEWEHAARAGSTEDSYAPINTIAWYGDNAERKTHPVGLKQPNAWGLYDTLGNVWEWCQDWYGPYLYQGETDPLGPNNGTAKVFRGGFWGNLKTVASRGSSIPPDSRYTGIGFRVVCVPKVERPE